MHTNSLLMFDAHARDLFKPDHRVLEIGPDGHPSSYLRRLSSPPKTWDTIDIFSDPHLTFTATSEYVFPIPDNSYDIVFAAQVIEHVRKIWVWIKEVARVCKPGGRVILINPVSWPYHPVPVDCWRIYPEGIQALFEDAGLEVELSKWDSLECPGHQRRLPGKSPEVQSRKFRLATRLLSLFGFPVECAYDTISIGRKHS